MWMDLKLKEWLLLAVFASVLAGGAFVAVMWWLT